MEYAVGKTGRVIAARLTEGDSLYESVEKIARDEDIRCAAVFITGGFREADVVVGPREEKPKLVPSFKKFTGPGEALGVGTIYWDDEKPVMHLHAAAGNGQDIIVGCPRGGAKTFLILEITIIEIVGIDAARKPDPESGLNLLKILS